MPIADPYTRPLADGRILCEVCPRICNIGPGERGHCYVRENHDGRMALATDGLVSALRVEPIERQRLNHFLPGVAALIVGTAGCNLACAGCDVHDPAKSRAVDAGTQRATPDATALGASERGCACVAFADNDPVVFYEYAIDIAHACRARGIRTVAATAGYVSPGPREEFFAAIDAASVDLKAFSEHFYYRRCGAHLDAVLETLKYIRRETDVWLEITTLLIPGENDSEAEIDALTRWVVAELGDETPLHFTAFRPAYQMRDHAPTPQATLARARAQAKANGLRHVYAGDAASQTSLCAGCGATLIVRDGDRLTRYALDAEGACPQCGRMLAGVFATSPSPTRGEGNGGARPFSRLRGKVAREA